MSAPGALSLPPDCQVWVYNDRMADGCFLPYEAGSDPQDQEPVVLTGLEVVWGRAGTLDQPSPATLTFSVMDREGGRRTMEILRLGSCVQVRSEAVIYPDPSVPIVADGGFESAATGSTPSAVWTNVAAGTVVTDRKHSGAKALRVRPIDGTRQYRVLIPPMPFTPGNPSGWVAIPQTSQGQTWRYGISYHWDDTLGSNFGIVVHPALFPSNESGAGAIVGPEMPDVDDITAGWVTMTGDVVPPAGYWLGVAVEVFPTGPVWEQVPWRNVLPRTNRATNPQDRSGGAAGWLQTRGHGAGGGLGTWTHSQAVVGPTGTGILTASRKTWTAASTSADQTGWNVGADGTNWFSVTPGEVLTLSAYMRHTSATAKDCAMFSSFYDRTTMAGAVQVGATAGGSIVAATSAGGWVRISQTVTVPAGALGMRAIPDVRGSSAGPWAIGNTLDGTGLMIEKDAYGGSPGSYFDGSIADTADLDYSWSGTAHASTSTAVDPYTISWAQLGVADPTLSWNDAGSIWLDDVRVLAPAGGALRKAVIFDGRITDLEARWQDVFQGLQFEVTAQDVVAELMNRDVGDTPWTVEAMSARAQRIVTASGQDIDLRVDADIAPIPISYRDVDSAGAAGLLQELAKSTDGVLWQATPAVGRPYLLIESMRNRPAMYVLYEKPNQMIDIKVRDDLGTEGIELPSCDVNMDPVRWTQDMTDMSSRLLLTWLEQGVDAQSKPTTTSREITLTDAAAMSLIGVRRISVSTQLTTSTDGDAVAASYLGRSTKQGWRISGLEIELATTEQFSQLQIFNAMQILDGDTRLGLPILLTEVPAFANPDGELQDVPLFLEGGRFRNFDGAWILDLVVSSAASVGRANVRWMDLPGYTTDVTRTNLFHNPRALASGSAGWTTGRGFGTGGAGNYSFLTGTTGPTGNITTARRKTWTVAATNNDGSGMQVHKDATTLTDVVAGTTITMQVYVRSSRNTVFRWVAQFFKTKTISGPDLISTVQGGNVNLTPNAWVRCDYTVAVPALAQGLLLFPDIIAGGGLWQVGNTLDMTGLIVEEVSSAGPVGYFDGDLANVGAARFDWTGVGSFSTSFRQPSTNRVNMALNPRAVSSGAGAWSSAVGYGTGGAGAISYATAASPSPVGDVTTCRRKTWSTASTGGSGVGFMVRGDASNYHAVTEGQTYTVSCYVRHSVTSRTYALRCRFFNSIATTGAQVGSDVSGAAVVVPAGTGWTRLSTTFTVPAGAVSVQLNPETTTSEVWPIGATQDCTALLIEKGSTLGEFFDGDSGGLASWIGAANNGTSRQIDDSAAWLWDEFEPTITWDDLIGVGI